MTAARCVALTICAFGIAPALAAPPAPLGDPFHVRHGESVELTRGVKLKLVDVSEGRCSGTCVWQGEAKAFANRAAALAAASRYVDAYTRSAKQVCTDWQNRQLASYVEDSSDLCWMIGNVLPTAHAVNEDAGAWRFYFMVDNPRIHTQENETLYFYVAMPKAPKDAFDQVRESDVHMLPCDVTLLDDTAHGGCNAQPR